MVPVVASCRCLLPHVPGALGWSGSLSSSRCLNSLLDPHHIPGLLVSFLPPIRPLVLRVYWGDNETSALGLMDLGLRTPGLRVNFLRLIQGTRSSSASPILSQFLAGSTRARKSLVWISTGPSFSEGRMHPARGYKKRETSGINTT